MSADEQPPVAGTPAPAPHEQPPGDAEPLHPALRERALAAAGAFARAHAPGGTPNPVPRFEHGSRVPGWDRAADLEKPPATIPGPERTQVPRELREEIEAHMARYPEARSAALPALAAAQRVHGWCSPQAIEQVASVMAVTPAYLESVASFYDMLETAPVGRHDIYVCTNISCSLCGADELFAAIRDAAASAPDGEREFNVRAFECLGACDIAPMASVDGVYVGPLRPDDALRLLEDVRAGRPVLEERQLARRPAADPRAGHGDAAPGRDRDQGGEPGTETAGGAATGGEEG